MTERNSAKPKISVVVTARNDNHGGGFIRRMQIFVTAWLKQCERHQLNAELIVVEWNPIEGNAALHEVLQWPEHNKYCSVRFIEVPKELHDKFVYGDRLGLYQMMAKNVGIRRALGDFVLCSNIDLLFSDALVAFMASEQLREGVIYRVDRLDIPAEIPEHASLDEQLAYCEENLLRTNAREGTINEQTGQKFVCAIGKACESTRMHFNACGDFSLMSKNDWYRIRGYAEFDMYSAHLDSVSMLAIHFSGIKETVLPHPMATYHIEHGFCMIAEKAGALFRMLQEKGVPQVSILELEQMGGDMQLNGRPILFNHETWGFARDALRETLVRRAEWQNANWPLDYGSQLACRQERGLMSLVVTTRPNESNFANFLRDLLEQTARPNTFELVVPATLDAPLEACLATCEPLLRIRRVEFLGADHGEFIRRALEEARGEQVLFVRSDGELSPDFVIWHQQFHVDHPSRSCGEYAAYSERTFGVAAPSKYSGEKGLEATIRYFEAQDQYEVLNTHAESWQVFRDHHFSCNRDVLLRYGGYDPAFKNTAFHEMGYRACRSNLHIETSVGPLTTRPIMPAKTMLESWAEEGEGKYRFVVKHPERAPKQWVQLEYATKTLARLSSEAQGSIEKLLRDPAQVTGEELEQIERFAVQNALMLSHRNAACLARTVKRERWQTKSVTHSGPHVMVLADEVPAIHGSARASKMFSYLQDLVKYARITVVLREAPIRVGDLDDIREMGLVVFADTSRIDQGVAEELSNVEVTPVAVEDLLEVEDYSAILLTQLPESTQELDRLREANPGLCLGAMVAEDSRGADARDTAIFLDFLVQLAGPHKALASEERMGPGASLLDVMMAIPVLEPVPTRKRTFDLADECELSQFANIEGRATLVVVLETSPDGANPYAIKEIEPVLFHGNVQLVFALAQPLASSLAGYIRASGDYYFTFENAGELDRMCGQIVDCAGTEYVAVTNSRVLLSPEWLHRMVSQLDISENIQVMVPRMVNLHWSSNLEFERDAWNVHEDHLGEVRPCQNANPDCFVIRKNGAPRLGSTGLVHSIVNDARWQNTTACAMDVLVAKAGADESLEERTWEGFQYETSCALSCIVFVGEARVDWESNLTAFVSQEAPEGSSMEVIVADRSADNRFSKRLKQWCEATGVVYLLESSASRERAMNRALALCRGRIVAFFDGSALPSAGTLAAHVEEHQRLPDHAGIFGMVHLDASSAFGEWFRGRIQNTYLMDPIIPTLGPITNPVRLRPSPVWTFNNVSLKREIISSIGALDETLKAGVEAYDYGTRLELAGLFVGYAQGASVRLNVQSHFDQFCKEWRTRHEIYALYMRRHPTLSGFLSRKRDEQYNGRGPVYDKCCALARKLEGLGAAEQSRYKWADGSLLSVTYDVIIEFTRWDAWESVLSESYGDNWFGNWAHYRNEDERYERANLTFLRLLEAAESVGDLNYSQAEYALGRAESLGDESPQTAFMMATVNMERNQPQGVLVWLEHAVKRAGKRQATGKTVPAGRVAFYRVQYAMSLLKNRRIAEAKEQLERVIHERCPISTGLKALVFSALGLCHKLEGRSIQAGHCSEEASRLKEDLSAVA